MLAGQSLITTHELVIIIISGALFLRLVLTQTTMPMNWKNLRKPIILSLQKLLAPHPREEMQKKEKRKYLSSNKPTKEKSVTSCQPL